MRHCLRDTIVEGVEDNVDFVDEEEKSLEVELASNVFKNKVVS